MNLADLILAESTFWVRWTDCRGERSNPKSTETRADRFAGALRESSAKRLSIHRVDR